MIGRTKIPLKQRYPGQRYPRQTYPWQRYPGQRYPEAEFCFHGYYLGGILPLPSSYTKSLSGILKLLCMKYNFASLAKQEKYKSLTAYWDFADLSLPDSDLIWAGDVDCQSVFIWTLLNVYWVQSEMCDISEIPNVCSTRSVTNK